MRLAKGGIGRGVLPGQFSLRGAHVVPDRVDGRRPTEFPDVRPCTRGMCQHSTGHVVVWTSAAKLTVGGRD